MLTVMALNVKNEDSKLIVRWREGSYAARAKNRVELAAAGVLFSW
jgi:hypothetical protein